MSVVTFVLLCAVAVYSIGLLVAMYVKDKPLYGAMAVFTLTGPGGVLSFIYAVVAA